MSTDFVSPYNPKNKYVTVQDIETILAVKGISIKVCNLQLYQQAFTHSSYTKAQYQTIFENQLKVHRTNLLQQGTSIIDLQDESNERLEFLGDTVIKYTISTYIFKRYPEQKEGFLTKLKTKIEDTYSLSRYALRLGLDRHILMSRQVEENNGRSAIKILEDTFESFIGALHLDQGVLVCERLMLTILESEVAYSTIVHMNTNYKDRLLQFYHSSGWSHPVYECIQMYTDEETSVKMYTMVVLDYQGNHLVKSSQNSKKKAEQECSKLALALFNQLNSDELKTLN